MDHSSFLSTPMSVAEGHHAATSRHQHQTGGILEQAENIVINGGNFTSVITSAKPHEDGFMRLSQHVAASAFHNSKQRLDPPRCHENTRRAVLQEIFDWIVGNISRSAWIAWLNGAAGAGKSAICQSMAEMCIAQGLLVASFFFFRTDSTRNTIDPLVATLAYQVIQLLPETRDFIAQAVESNPLIFEQAFDTQLDVLICQPLLRLKVFRCDWKLLLIIDGLDECSGDRHQINLIRMLTKALRTHNLPLIVLFGSRQENQIKMAFNSPDVNRILLRLPLDDHYFPDNDICLFLNDSFYEIQQTHPLNHRLSPDWPAPALVQEIVDKSSGQFIYAAVVIKFVSFPRSNPATQLDIVRGLRPSGHSAPFAQLDALYRHIFSQVQDLQTNLSVLAYIIYGTTPDLKMIATFFRMTEDDVHTALADLTSVVACKDSNITFLHASLPDFLVDRLRSAEYCINTPTWHTRLCILWYQNAASGRLRGWSDSPINNFLANATASPELRASMLTFRPSQNKAFFKYPAHPTKYLTAIRELDFGDGGEVYRHQLNLLVRYIKRLNPKGISAVRQVHDIEKILYEIERESDARVKLSRLAKLKAWFNSKFKHM